MYLVTIHWKDASNANTNPRCTKEEKVTQAFPLLCTPLLTAAPAAAPGARRGPSAGPQPHLGTRSRGSGVCAQPDPALEPARSTSLAFVNANVLYLQILITLHYAYSHLAIFACLDVQ